MSRPTRGRSWRRWGLRILALAVLGVVVGGGAWSVLTPVGSGARRVVTVNEGESVWEVAAGLEKMGLVRNVTALATAAYATGKWRRIQAGRHEVDAGMTGIEILDALCRKPEETGLWLTIPEGYTVWQIAEKVEEEGIGEASEFLAAAHEPRTFEVAFPLPATSLEGYLFPDTYKVEQAQGARGSVAQMLRRFEEVVWEGVFGGEAEPDGRSLTEVMIVASLVEGEAKRDEERPIVAGVLMNRLERGQKLECDATVQYALGRDRKSRLTYEDLQIDSEYNTYLHEGLPPGPICSPGESSIRAAMAPAEVPYLYYVAQADGSHIFSRTYREHQAAIARIRRGSR